MIYKELHAELNLATEEMSRVFGGTSASREFFLSDPALQSNGGPCHNISQCAKLNGYQSKGDAYQTLGVNPGDINQQNLTWGDVFPS